MTTSTTTKTDLLLLGMLLDRPMHGYELYQQIQAEGIDDWFNVSAAGVYYSLGKLRDHNLVAETQQRGGRSSRKSIYRLTERGRTAFFEAMEAELACREECYLDYDLAIYLLNRLPMQRAMPGLEERLAYLADKVAGVQSALAAEQNNGRSPFRLAILDHKLRFLEMERSWLDDVMADIRNSQEGEGEQGTGRRGMMTLSGDLRHHHLPDLIRLIVSGRHTGTLSITRGNDVHLLSFEQGQPICASHQRRGAPRVPSTSLDEVLNGLCDCFHSQEGEFHFDQRTDCRELGIDLNLSAEALILRGCRRVEDWTIIQRLVPSAETILELGSGAAKLDELDLRPVEARVAATVDGLRDVATIARELDLTLFEASRTFYCLAAIGVLRTADPDKIRLRRVFREIAELMCESTRSWRATPDDRSCEEEVNERCQEVPIRLNDGRIEDRADPQLGIDELSEIYCYFLKQQYRVVSRRFGASNAREAFERVLRQLAPELQSIARRYGFNQVAVG
jgi:DNA-binding PadR family transcriptional regulator